MTLRGQARLDATTLPALVDQLNALLGRLQSGGLLLNGAHLDTSLTAMPTAAPGPNDPVVRMVNFSGVLKLVNWTGTTWIVTGTAS